VIGLATYLSLGPWQSIWPVFGASNQLVAALTLLVVTVWLLTRNKTTLYTLIPSIFMLIFTLTALTIQSIKFFKSSKILLGSISILLFFLALFMLYETIKVFILKLKTKSGDGA
ncbi:MAG: carbon starvation CstA 5TM domain-containing protein, partial [candidate division WOR-3 bacterium]